MVVLDAKQAQPTVGMTLTTRRADFDSVRYRRAVEAVFRWLRREFGPGVGYLLMMEWTTGSGGHGRLPHGHLLVKRLPAGLDLSDGCELWRELKALWERHTGAWRVELRELHTASGAIAYMVGHHHKSEQAPPAGWSGKRFRPSQNYFERPIAELREQARRDRAHFREAARLLELIEATGDVELVEQRWAHQDGTAALPDPAELVRVQVIPERFGDDGLPASWTLEVLERVAA